MSPQGLEIVAGLLALALVVTIYGLWPAFSAWLKQWALVRQFRRSLRLFDSRHVDVWRRESGGREPPR